MVKWVAATGLLDFAEYSCQQGWGDYCSYQNLLCQSWGEQLWVHHDFICYNHDLHLNATIQASPHTHILKIILVLSGDANPRLWLIGGLESKVRHKVKKTNNTATNFPITHQVPIFVVVVGGGIRFWTSLAFKAAGQQMIRSSLIMMSHTFRYFRSISRGVGYTWQPLK